MTESTSSVYLEPTQESGRALMMRRIEGNVVMLSERWDAAMLVRQRSINDFMAFASDREYMAGLGHRVAALEDSRLLPLVEEPL